jgi:hypothetical protein
MAKKTMMSELRPSYAISPFKKGQAHQCRPRSDYFEEPSDYGLH